MNGPKFKTIVEKKPIADGDTYQEVIIEYDNGETQKALLSHAEVFRYELIMKIRNKEEITEEDINELSSLKYEEAIETYCY